MIRFTSGKQVAVFGLAASVVVAIELTNRAHVQASYAFLHTFTGAPTDGGLPDEGLIQSFDGTLYGTTANGGSDDRGTIFQITSDGSGYTLLRSFTADGTDGALPNGLIQGFDGTLFGTTRGGGSANLGTVFQIAPDGSGYTLLYSFTGDATDGAFPYAGLIQGPDGTLYGTTSGHVQNTSGTIFQIAPDGSGFKVLHNFTRTPMDGSEPDASLIQGPDGTLYGTTAFGGSNGYGTIFQIAPDGTGFALLHSFTGETSDGAYPHAGLIQGPDGTLYGTTASGGPGSCPGGCGTVFRLAPDGSGFTLLHTFTGVPTDGQYASAGLIQGPDGTFYGTTAFGGFNGYGTIFQMDPDGGNFTLLHSFTGGLDDGFYPYDGVIQGPDGTLYGTTYAGGRANEGVVFSLSPPLQTKSGRRTRAAEATDP
jgi:uncharacterized repeat protein (TIGR03803 family)